MAEAILVSWWGCILWESVRGSLALGHTAPWVFCLKESLPTFQPYEVTALLWLGRRVLLVLLVTQSSIDLDLSRRRLAKTKNTEASLKGKSTKFQVCCVFDLGFQYSSSIFPRKCVKKCLKKRNMICHHRRLLAAKNFGLHLVGLGPVVYFSQSQVTLCTRNSSDLATSN